ncbi:MAG TPA: BON domain-containing protein, partial [Anaerolineales bacterium]|nr:BON domain-containing protein [Anaerolineales bacterium]
RLEHTYDCKFFTGTSHGVVSINGNVRDDHVKLLAEQCAAANPNVRGVINNVQVAGTNPAPSEQPFLQPVIGQAIYFRDGVSGTVKQAIIDPNNRLVIQLIIEGKFSNQKQNLKAGTDQQTQTSEKIVVIPVNLIRYLTKSSGFLTIKSTETTQFQDFNPLYFTSPKSDWVLPYPYCPGDVLLKIETVETENQRMVDPDILQINISAQPTTAKAPEMPVDIISTWEDDGGQIIQPAEAVAMAVSEISTAGIYSSHVNDSLGG